MNQPKLQEGTSQYARYMAATIRRTKALALREEIRNRKIAGELVDKSLVEAEWFTLARQVRDALENIPARAAGLVAAEKKQEKCFAILEKEIRQALESLTAEKP